MADLFSSAGTLAGGLFGSPDDPYKKMMKQATRYADQAASYQNPFYNSGVNSIPQYEEWLGGMKDPSEFINNLMGGYSASPYAQYQQEQSMRSANNMASANGLSGSTPMMLQAQENASNISSGDMNNWLSQVLGINTQYGSGLNNNINRGQQSANNLSNIYGSLGNLSAGGAYNAELAKQQRTADIISGLLGMGQSGSQAYFGSQGNNSGGEANGSGGMDMGSIMKLLMMMG